MKEVYLYINGMKAELSESPEILFTYQADELTNPTIVKNSYTKTIQLKGCEANDEIFDNIWHLERTQSLENFNPSKKAPFTIYVGDDIYQTGYVKLTDIHRNGNEVTYDISLFGGLGGFFYSLMYSNSDDVGESEKMKLSDLRFRYWDSTVPSEREMDFTINKETVLDAWEHLETDDRTNLWHTINFGVFYNGKPSDNFNADKVLINTIGRPSSSRRGGATRYTDGLSFPTATTVDGTSYTTMGGYCLGELPSEYTEHQMRDLRSYLQRPVLRVRDVIEAICQPENNGGYEVELDEDFFNNNNPYWDKAWMTLPMLTSMDYIGNAGEDDMEIDPTVTYSSSAVVTNYNYKEQHVVDLGEFSADTSYNLSLDVDFYALLSGVTNLVTASTRNEPTAIVPCAYSKQSNVDYPGAIEVQLVAYSQDGKVVGGSDLVNLTSTYQVHRTSSIGMNTTVEAIVPTPNDFNFKPEHGSAYTTNNSSFYYYGDNKTKWRWNNTFNLTAKNIPPRSTLKIVINKLSKDKTTNGWRRMFQKYYDNDGHTLYRQAALSRFEIDVVKSSITYNTNEGIRTGAKFTKANLLNTDYTPCDFLLSYAKLFGLYFLKHPVEDKIYILTRKNFYRRDRIVDITKSIDRGQEIAMKPIAFDAKWYNWALESDETLFYESYRQNYGIDYGVAKVNTGYNFDGNDRDLLEGNIFRGAIECLERSDMYSYIGNDTNSKPWMYQGLTYNLWNAADLEDSTEMTVSASSRVGVLKPFSDIPYYDLFPKVQFHSDDNNEEDGSRVLVFYDGRVMTNSTSNGARIHYWLTDDNSYMNIINENTPCWLYTVTETDTDGNNIAKLLTWVPHFGRYMVNEESKVITRSWDFGEPKTLYIPDYRSTADSTIYNSYWRSYITDLYDIDTRVLTCHVAFDGRVTEEWLRDFYYFDNTIWRISKVNDYNLTDPKTTEVEFVKVQDLDNYTSEDVDGRYSINLSFGYNDPVNTKVITNDGARVRIYVDASNNTGAWYVNESVWTYSTATSGTGDSFFDLVIPANTDSDGKIYYVSCSNSAGRWSNTLTIRQENSVLEAQFQPPWSHRDIYQLGESGVPLSVKSTYPFTITADRNWNTMTPTSVNNPDPVYGRTVSIDWMESDSLSWRTTVFTITDSTGNSIKVRKSQDGLSMAILEFPYSGGSRTINYPSGRRVMSPDWAVITDNLDDTYTVTAKYNSAGARENTASFIGYDPLTRSDLDEVAYLTIKQGAAPSSGDTGNDDFMVERWGGTGDANPNGEYIKLKVTCDGRWELQSSADFIGFYYDDYTEYGNIEGTGSTWEIKAKVQPNSTGAWRQGTITLRDWGNRVFNYTIAQSFFVQDAASANTLYVSPDYLVFDPEYSSKPMSVTNFATGNTWYVQYKSLGANWLNLSETTGGSGTTTVAVIVDEYTPEQQASDPPEGRQGVIILSNNVNNVTISVRQMKDETPDTGFIRVTPSNISFESAGGTSSTTITSTDNWTAEDE